MDGVREGVCGWVGRVSEWVVGVNGRRVTGGSELMGLFNGLEESVDVVRGRSIEILSMFNSGG